MDLIRDPYTKDCTFNKDDDATCKVAWRPTLKDAPALPFPSIILNRGMEPDPWLEVGVGEVAGAQWTFGGYPVPEGIDGTHYCGTEEDFAEGGTLDVDLPEVRYGSSGFPLCCDPPLGVRGGAGAAGPSVVKVIKNWSRGGAGASGKSKWGSPCPGLSCAEACQEALGITYTFVMPTPLGTEHWFRFPASVGSQEAVFTGLFTTPIAARGYLGSTCADKVYAFDLEPGSIAIFPNPTGAPYLYVLMKRIGNSAAGTYSLFVQNFP